MSRIQELEPVYTPIPLAPYCEQGKLFPSEEATHRFIVDVFRAWREVRGHNTWGWDRKSYHVFNFDFGGVTTFDPAGVCDAFSAMVWSNCLGQPDKYVCSTFESIGPWDQFRALMAEARRRRAGACTVMAQRQNRENYEVVGGDDNEIVYGKTLGQLPQGEWFRATDLAREVLAPRGRQLLYDMRNDGLLLCHEVPGGHLYRTLV